MQLIGKPGVDKVDFELWCLAGSAINGCGMCMDSHEKVVREGGLPASAVQTAVRFAAIIQSAAVALETAAVVAAWTRGCEGVDDAGAPIVPADRDADALAERAALSRTEPLAFVAEPDLFGDLADRSGFTEPYLAALSSLRESGARATLRELLAQ